MKKTQKRLIERIYKETASLQITFNMIAELSQTKAETATEIFNFLEAHNLIGDKND